MKLDVLDIKGNKVEQLDLLKDLFEVEKNTDLIAQYMRVYNANQRQGTVSTKNRGEVSGGGKKPWKQKGTGRARAGSTRNPIFRHGGVAHGPKPKDWSLSMPKKMRNKALAVVLSERVRAKSLKVLNDIVMDKPSTRELQSVIDNLKIAGGITLVMDRVDAKVLKSASNIKGLNVSFVENLNAYDVLSKPNTVLVKNAVKKLESKYEAK